MFIRIQRGSGVPVSRQIAEQIRAACASGSLQPGDRLPSVRELARELAVNQNTVLRVYDKLAGEGFIEQRHGDGTFVAPQLPKRQLKAQQAVVQEALRRAAALGAELGLSRKQLHDMLDDVLHAHEKGSGS